MELFDTQSDVNSPLAEKRRPKHWSEMVGHKNLLGEDSPIRKALESGRVVSMILWGPPGCGKTTFARSLSQITGFEFLQLHAVETGSKALREIGQQAQNKRKYYGQKQIVFIDEIHRLNKSQQDVLLPFVESGDITLIGATTENPSFEVNSALLSRCRMVRLEKLTDKDLVEILTSTFESESLVFDKIMTEAAKSTLVEGAEGDARRLLGAIESISSLYSQNPQIFPLGPSQVETHLGEKSFQFSKRGDDRFDLISAMIKSIRGSDADAGLYYLARLIKAGEDVNFIARRLVILASEDVGNADPQGLVVAVSTQTAVDLVGLPEAGIVLAQAVTYLATAPKSNRSYIAYKKALKLVEEKGSLSVPMSLRNAPNRQMKDWGFGEGYKYAHDTPKGFSPEIKFLPAELGEEKLYHPSNRGHELKILKYLEWIKES